MKDMHEIKFKTDNVRNSVAASDMLGKKVIAKNGKRIGEIRAIHIHPKRLTVEGIRFKKGLSNKDNFIGKGYIQSLNQEGAMLKIIPLHEIVGMDVYDASGKKVGSVKEISRANNTNTIKSMLIHRGVMKKDFRIKGSAIKDIDKTVVIKTEVRDK